VGAGSVIFRATIGAHSYLGHYCTIQEADIGTYCSVSWNVTVIGIGAHPIHRISTHPFSYGTALGFAPRGQEALERRPTRVGHDCWIGAGAIIVPGVLVGSGAVVGAGSVVTANVDDYSIVAGNPARHVRYRFDEETRALLRGLKWWDWPTDRLAKHIELFQAEVKSAGHLRQLLADQGIAAPDR
jgi:acetyltransferase-like isoleucine patch superfamily enzyme